MPDKKKIADCTCPLCKAADAELWEDVKGKPYMKCETCVTMIKSMSRVGQSALRALVTKAAPPEPAPEKKPKEKKPEPAPAAEAPRGNSRGMF